MAEHEDWTAQDDAVLRSAMNSLRADVESVPLADARFVRARGAARRRQRILTVTAAGAAAAVVVGAVGFAQLGRTDGEQALPATRTTTTTSPTSAPMTSVTAPPLDTTSLVPVAADWKWALELDTLPKVSSFTTPQPIDCVDDLPRVLDTHESVEFTAENVQGAQAHFLAPSSADGARAADSLASQVAGCALPQFRVTPVATKEWPKTWSYTAGGAGSGWFVVTRHEADVTLLQVVDPGKNPSQFTAAQVSTLAQRATDLLTAPRGAGTPTGPATTAIDAKMPVSGPDPKPSSSLFVAASQWTSPFFAKGATATAGPQSPDASLAIVQCETDEQQAGVAGRVGTVEIRAGQGDANVVGKQRVRVFDDVRGYELAQADLARLDQLVMKGCTSAGGNRTTAERGPVQGTYLLTTKVVDEATGTMYQWVGATGMQTEGAVSTVVFHSDGKLGFTGTKEQGFDQLVKLMDLARQK